ncbi:unnamed protein product, partial [Nesidiocoris tenuis]
MDRIAERAGHPWNSRELSLLGQEIAALLHQRPDGEPHAVQKGELIFEVVRIWIARMGILPLIWSEPANITSYVISNIVEIHFRSQAFGWRNRAYE